MENQSQALQVYDEDLQNFKKLISAWVELDSIVQKLQETLKEKKKLKLRIQAKITEFMQKYQVEDVNTKDVKLRYKMIKTKVPLSRQQIKQRVVDNYGDKAPEIVEKIFENSNTVDKPTLRKLKITPSQIVINT
jgi:hypothetical protein